MLLMRKNHFSNKAYFSCLNWFDLLSNVFMVHFLKAFQSHLQIHLNLGQIFHRFKVKRTCKTDIKVMQKRFSLKKKLTGVASAINVCQNSKCLFSTNHTCLLLIRLQWEAFDYPKRRTSQWKCIILQYWNIKHFQHMQKQWLMVYVMDQLANIVDVVPMIVKIEFQKFFELAVRLVLRKKSSFVFFSKPNQ